MDKHKINEKEMAALRMWEREKLGDIEESFREFIELEMGTGYDFKLFDDALEKLLYLALLKTAYEGGVGKTSAMLADQLNPTKNTINTRLGRLEGKGLIRKDVLGNAIVFFVPLPQLLLKTVLFNTEFERALDDVVREEHLLFLPSLPFFKGTKEVENLTRIVLG